MPTDCPLHALSPYPSMLRMERAKQEALRLRREAIASFWSDVATAARTVFAALRRRVQAPIAPTELTQGAAPCQH